MEVFPNVRKYVGIPDCLTIASTSYKKLFPDCWCFFDWTYKWKCIVLCNKSFDCSFKITFNCSCCECTWFDFLPSKVYWWTQMEMLMYRHGKKYIICIWCTVLIKVQQPLIKVPSRTYWNNLEELWIQIYPLEEDKEMLALHRINRLRWKLVFSLGLVQL